KDVWLCNMCYHRRHLIASSGSWYHRQRGKPQGSGRRSSLDEATMAINAGRFEGKRFERNASFSEYENIRDSVLESVDIQYVPKVADELRKVASESLERTGISEIISTGVKFLDQRSSSDEAQESHDQHSREQPDSNQGTMPETSMTSSFSASDSGLESMRGEDTTPTQVEDTIRTSLDLDDEEMRKMLIQMSSNSIDGPAQKKDHSLTMDVTSSDPLLESSIVGANIDKQQELVKPNDHPDGATSRMTTPSTQDVIDLPTIKERKSILDSEEFKSIEEQIYSHTEGFKEIFKSFNFSDKIGSTSSLDMESSNGDIDSEEEDLQMEALVIDKSSTITSEEPSELQKRDNDLTDLTAPSSYEEIEMMLANEKPKRHYSLDFESLSDSEIRVCGGKTKSKKSIVIGEKPSHSSSDPKLSERGRALLTAEDYLQQGCFLGKNTAKSSSFYGFPSEKEEKPEMRYRSVGDLTKIGVDTDPDEFVKPNRSSRTATPIVAKSQFQYPSNRKQKPNSLPKRKRSRRMVENPLSPIWDVDTSGSPGPDYPTGDFPSPEYADPSLAEESPLEYEDEEDIDIEDDCSAHDNTRHYSNDAQTISDIYGSGDLEDLLEEDDEDEEFRLHEEYSRKASLTPEDAFQLETVMEEEEEDYEMQNGVTSLGKQLNGSPEKSGECSDVTFESFSSDADSKDALSEIKSPKHRPPPLKLYHDHTKVMPASSNIASKPDTQVLESPPTPVESSGKFEKPILSKVGEIITSPDADKQDTSKEDGHTLEERKRVTKHPPKHKPPPPPPIPPKPKRLQKGIPTQIKDIKQTSPKAAAKTAQFFQEPPMSPRLLATYKQLTESKCSAQPTKDKIEGSGVIHEGESLQEKVQQFEQFIKDTNKQSSLPDATEKVSRPRKKETESESIDQPVSISEDIKPENKEPSPAHHTEHTDAVLSSKAQDVGTSTPTQRTVTAIMKSVHTEMGESFETHDVKSTTTVATSTSKDEAAGSIKDIRSKKHQSVSVGTGTVSEGERTDSEGDKVSIAVMYTSKGSHLLSIRPQKPKPDTEVRQLESPMISPTGPTTSSIAVGTSPDVSPTTSDSEPLFVPKTKMFREKGVGTDRDNLGAVPSASSRASSGDSTPEMVVRLGKRQTVTDASMNASIPTSSSRQLTSDGQVEYSSKCYSLTGTPSHKRQATGVQTQGSDVSDSDSERGSSADTSKIRRRLPPVPSNSMPVSTTVLKGSLLSTDGTTEPTLDIEKPLNLQYIREMLSRKAAELEKQRRQVETVGKKTEEDKKRLDMTATRITRRQERRQKGTGMIFDVDEMVMMHDSESKDSDDDGRSKSTSSLHVLRPFTHGFVLSKSEEDIIRQIEKQISESTGTQYRAYERAEIEREVRQKYGLSDCRGLTTSPLQREKKKHDAARRTHSDGEFEDTIYDSHISRSKYQSEAAVRRTSSSSPPVLRQYRMKDKKRKTIFIISVFKLQNIKVQFWSKTHTEALNKPFHGSNCACSYQALCTVLYINACLFFPRYIVFVAGMIYPYMHFSTMSLPDRVVHMGKDLLLDFYQQAYADYYYSSQEIKMEASEWTRRADDSDVEEYRSGHTTIFPPRKSSFSSQKSEQTREYSFPTKKFCLSKDPSDRSSRGNGLGMRIVGGKCIPGTRQVGAYIAEIYPGGVAEKVSELHLGDEILEWCGIPLEGKTYEETQKIISSSDGEVEIVIRSGLCMMTSPRKTISTKQILQDNQQFDSIIYDSDGKCTNGVDPRTLTKRLEGIQSHSPSQSSESFSTSQSTSSDTSTPKRKRKERMKSIKGEIELQLDYDDNVGDLFINVMKARDLAPKDRNGLADPFVKICLLPGRCAENKRRTMYVPRTLNPNWNQTFVFRGIRRKELCTKTLEILVWDYDRFSTNDFMGQVLIELSRMDTLDNNPRWYKLQHQGEVAPAEAHTPQLVSPIKPGGCFLQPPTQMIRPKTRSEQSTSDPAFWKRVSDGTSYPVSSQADADSAGSSAYEYDTDRSTSDISAVDRDHPQTSDSGVQLICKMSPEESQDISTSLTRIDDAIRALKLTDQPIPIKRDKSVLRTRALSKSPKRRQRRPLSANFDLRTSRLQKANEICDPKFNYGPMRRSLSTSPPDNERKFFLQERPTHFNHPAYSSSEINSPFLACQSQSSRSSSTHTLDSPSLSSSNNQLKDKTPSPDVVKSTNIRHRSKGSNRNTNSHVKDQRDRRNTNISQSTSPSTHKPLNLESSSLSETAKLNEDGSRLSNHISQKSTIKADVVIHNDQAHRRSNSTSEKSYTESKTNQTKHSSRKPHRKSSRDEDPLNYTSRDPKRRPSYDGGESSKSSYTHCDSRTESPVFKLQENVHISNQVLHGNIMVDDSYNDRGRSASCRLSTNPAPMHERVRQDSGFFPKSERVRKRKKTKGQTGGQSAESEAAARRLSDRADSNSQLWNKQPGEAPCTERQSATVNMKTAVYTRMLIGDNLGPGQVVDPELPRQSDVLWKATRDSTGEIKLGLRKDKRSDGESFYVDIIMCRKISFKFKDTDHIPGKYIKIEVFYLIYLDLDLFGVNTKDSPRKSRRPISSGVLLVAIGQCTGRQSP
ncbi:uncharacterized protein LOC117105879, partial [Anneissia japonica]|uniref:uncharacterized protein LOC117105879 n=1 Tax=Anneissia japonica TaxID=1529436 RepID=UPI001425B937